MSLEIKVKLNYIGVSNPPAEFVTFSFTKEDLKLYRGITELLQNTSKPFLAIDTAWHEIDFEDFVLRDRSAGTTKEKIKQDNLLIHKDGLIRYWINFEAGGSAYADLLNLNNLEEDED